MRIFGLLILLCLCASLGSSSFAQTLIYLAPGTTTQLTKAPTTSFVYYGGGYVKFDPTYDFSAAKGYYMYSPFQFLFSQIPMPESRLQTS